MRFKYQSDNENLTERLERMVEQEPFPTRISLKVPGYVDKKSFADSFAKGILCPVARR